MRSHQSGNVVILILVAVGLFGALAYTFMRGNDQGQGNLTSNQARIAAQELANYFNVVEKTVNKLRLYGCSQTDISFANNYDNGTRLAFNDSITAPSDKSCHVFDSNGGKLAPLENLSDFQVSSSSLSSSAQDQIGQIYYRFLDTSVVDLGTSAYDFAIKFNFVKPEICAAFNELQKNDIDLSILDSGKISGDENTGLKEKTAFCRYEAGSLQDGGPNTAILYIWLAQ